MCRRLCTLATSVLLLGSILVGVAPAGDPTLVGWWKLDAGAGTTAADSSDYGNDGAFNGDPQWTAGYFGGALEFDGTGDYLDCGNDASLDVTTWTITFWLNLNENKNYNGYIVKGVDAAEHFEILTYGAGNFHFPILFEDGARGFSNTAEGVTVVGEWSHYTYTYDASEGRRFYKDGVLIFEDTESRVPQITDEPLIIGNEGGTSRFVPGVMDDIRIYNRILTAEELADVLLGKGPGSGLAADPNPENEATDVPRDVPLSWEAGEFAVTHDVYLGTVFEDVNEASRTDDRGMLISQGQTTTTIDPEGVFEYGQTYYWRVDEVNGAPDNTIFKGETWSFTVEPLGYPIENVVATSNGAPQSGAVLESIVNGAGLNENDEHSIDSGDMWLAIPPAGELLTIEFAFDGVYKLHEMLVWNYNVQVELLLGFGLKDVTIEYSEDGADWTALGDVAFNQATTKADYTANTTVDFGGAAAQHVRITVNSGHGVLGQFGLSEIRFLYIPVQAREPQPEDGAVDVTVDANLSWRAGREAVSSEVYLSTDPDALALVETVSTTTADPGALDLDATYYWKIAEVNEAEAVSIWDGPVWSFSTETYIVIEDFESYDDDENRIYQTWVDGYGVDDNGSQVGHLESPFAEQTIAVSGQSMPLFYENAGTSMSEAELTLAANWTTSGVKSLAIAFQGAAGNTGQLYVKINGTKIPYDGDAGDIALTSWQAFNIDLSTVGNVGNVTSLIIGVEGAGAAGVVYIDDVRLYPNAPEYITPVDPGAEGLVAYYGLDGDASDGSGNGNHGTVNGGAAFVAGQIGSALDCDGADDYVETGKSASDLGIGGNEPRTVSSWVFTRSFNNGGIYDVGARTATQDFCLRTMDTENTWRIQYWGGDFDFTHPTANEWVHFTHVHDGAATKIYANGILIVDWEKTIDTSDTNPFQIGCYGWQNDYFDGLIDEVRVFNRAVSAGEALSLAGQTTPKHKPF